jgi:hypothetical protein
MRFSLKDVGADIRSRDRTYGSSCHSGRTDPSPDVRLVCDGKALFSPIVELNYSKNFPKFCLHQQS